MARLDIRSERNGEAADRPNKHQQRTAATRRKLLAAARRIFVRDGFEAARLEDIAAEAGHTRGAFYANFQSKEDLFFALLEQQATRNIEKIRRAMESCPNPQHRLRTLRELYASRLADRQWMMLSLEFKLFALRHGHIRARLAETHRRFRASVNVEIIENLLPERLRTPLESREECKVALEAMVSGLALEYAYDPKRISASQAAEILRRTFDTWMNTAEPAK